MPDLNCAGIAQTEGMQGGEFCFYIPINEWQSFPPPYLGECACDITLHLDYFLEINFWHMPLQVEVKRAKREEEKQREKDKEKEREKAEKEKKAKEQEQQEGKTEGAEVLAIFCMICLDSMSVWVKPAALCTYTIPL